MERRSCTLSVVSTLGNVFTYVQWVERVLTKTHKKIPKAIINNGYIKLEILNMHPEPVPIREVDDITSAAQVDSAKDPKRSADMPATSPTLSPTLSAIVAGFLGLSSGNPV